MLRLATLWTAGVPAVAPAFSPGPSRYSSVTEAITLVVLLTEFAMLRAGLSRSQVRLYAFQSFAVSVLAVFVAANNGIGELYAVAILAFVLKVVVVPAILTRLLRDAYVGLVASHRLRVATMVLIAIVVSVLAFIVIKQLPIRSPSLPTATMGIACAVILVSFLLVILRSDVVSQAVGTFSLGNGIDVANFIIAAGLPLILGVVLLFDLLVAAVVFGLLIRAHHGRARTLSTETLEQLRG